MRSSVSTMVLWGAGTLLFCATGCTQQPKSGGASGTAAGSAAGRAAVEPATKPATAPKPVAKLPVAPPRPTKLLPRPAKREEYAGSHILVAYKGALRASAKITRSKDEALKLARDLTKRAKKAPKTFAELAKKHSDGPSAKDGGSLGVWRKGRMVKAFDTAIGTLAIGAISDEPVETKFGFHVMRRDVLPPTLAGAHILIAWKGARRANPKVTRTKEEALALATKLSVQLKKDASKFNELAAQNSDGPAAKRGGLLGVWRKGASHPVFDKTIAALKIGRVSAPTETAFGIHVFLRLPEPPRLAGSHILISYKGARRAAPYITRSKDEALKLAKELAMRAAKDPAGFGELALKNSDGPSTPFGGDLGDWAKGAMMPAFDAAVEKLAVGEVTKEPVETAFGFHVIKRNALPAEGDDAPAKAPPGKAKQAK